jgi:hypothetical protein
VPWAIANAAYKRQRHNPGVTEIVKIPNRGHALTLDTRLAEGRADCARFRQALRPGKAELGGLDLGGFSDQFPIL